MDGPAQKPMARTAEGASAAVHHDAEVHGLDGPKRERRGIPSSLAEGISPMCVAHSEYQCALLRDESVQPIVRTAHPAKTTDDPARFSGGRLASVSRSAGRSGIGALCALPEILERSRRPRKPDVGQRAGVTTSPTIDARAVCMRVGRRASRARSPSRRRRRRHGRHVLIHP